MMGRRGALEWGLAGLALAALPIGCAGPFRHRYRFRLAVEVDTPLGLRRGSGVIAVWATYNMPGSSERLWGVEGEAVAVDLPGGQVLFALLKTNAIHNDMAGLSMTALDPAFKNDVVESAQRIGRGTGIVSPVAVAPKDYPMLVRFRDLSDPKSVEQVQPDALEKAFGSGVRLRRITVQVTDDPVTTGIKKRLPSFGPETGYQEWVNKLKYGDPLRIGIWDFTLGVAK